jgi:hypothetical protein
MTKRKARKKYAKPVILGERVGTKAKDTRWLAPDGTVWASRFEYQVYSVLKDKGYDVRKTTEQDRQAYTAAVRNGKCTQCGGVAVVSQHTYTPDLFVRTGQAGGIDRGYYVEAKGYLRGDRRSLLRSFRKTGPAIDLRLVIQRDYPVGKSTLKDWAERLCKMPTHVWNGDLPTEWRQR